MKIHPVANEEGAQRPWLAAVTGGRRAIAAATSTSPRTATANNKSSGSLSSSRSSSPPTLPTAALATSSQHDTIPAQASAGGAAASSGDARSSSNANGPGRGAANTSLHLRGSSRGEPNCGFAPVGLEDLPPDVLHNVLVCLGQQDVARVRRTSKRMRRNAKEAAQFWAAKVQERLLKEGEGGLEGVWVLLQQRREQDVTHSIDWLQVWSCVDRAARGPWHFDVRKLGPLQAPNGVLLVFEVVMMQGPAPSSQCLRRDSVTTMLSFVLDGKNVEVVVDANGRLSSPQQDWCQNAIYLQSGKPLTLALEVSYIFPVPAWFVHPCLPRGPESRLALDLSTGFGSFVIDPRYLESHHSAVPPLCSGLERLELGSRLCWRQSRMAALLNRFLPGRGSFARGAGGRRGGGRAAPGVQLRVGAVTAWQVPSDNERRFREGFLFSAEEQELQQLLRRYGVLQPV